MRILGVDVTETEPINPPVPGRAQAWQSSDAETGTSVTHVQFIDEQHQLTSHICKAVQPLPAAGEDRSTIAVLASHPNDVQSAIASYRVLGWGFAGQAAPSDFDKYGYALCLLVSNPRFTG